MIKYMVVNTLGIIFLLFSSQTFAQCQGRYYDCQKLQQESGVKINGETRGRVREIGNTIYVRNLKIYQKNSNDPALQVVTTENDRKRVIVENVEVNVKNASVSSNYGMAASVGLHFENSGNKVRNLNIHSSGINQYYSNSTNPQNAAGVHVEQYSRDASYDVDSTRTTVNTSGSEIIHSIQNLP